LTGLPGNPVFIGLFEEKHMQAILVTGAGKRMGAERQKSSREKSFERLLIDGLDLLKGLPKKGKSKSKNPK
jgi:hypothetical protein